MESNKQEEAPTSKNKGANLRTAANTGISTAEKEKSFHNSVEEEEEDLDNGTPEDKSSYLYEGSEFVNDSGDTEAPKRENKKPNLDSPH